MLARRLLALGKGKMKSTLLSRDWCGKTGLADQPQEGLDDEIT